MIKKNSTLTLAIKEAIESQMNIKKTKPIESELHPKYGFSDIANLPNYSIYLKLMVDGIPSKPFSADTLASIET